MFLYLLSSESSLDELDGDGEDEYLRCFFFLSFLLLDRCRFFDFFECLFGEGLLSSSVLLSFEELLRLLDLFLLGCSFRGSATLGETLLLLHLWSLFELIREGLFSWSLEPLSLPDVMLDLCFKTEEAFIYWLNFTVILWWQSYSDFELQIEFRRSASDSDKDWKRRRGWAPVWYRLVRGTKYSIIWDFMKKNSVD